MGSKMDLIKILIDKRDKAIIRQRKLDDEDKDFPNVKYKDLDEKTKKYIYHVIRWWIIQSEIDLLHDLIHGGAGCLNEGIITKYVEESKNCLK